MRPVSKGSRQRPRGWPFSPPRGDCPIPPVPKHNQCRFHYGGSAQAGLGYLPRRTDVLLANLFELTFLDSGASPVCVYRFSGASIRLGAWGVVVKGDEHDSGSADVDPVTVPFRTRFPVSTGLGPNHWACTLGPPAAPISAPPGTVSGGAGSEILGVVIVNDGLDLRHRRSRLPPAPPMGAAPDPAPPRTSGPPGTS